MDPREDGAPPVNSSDPPRERSTTFWFNDGNVVLRTRTTQYRVHQGLLGSQSSVFRDIFTVPQPGSRETVDGCPVIDVAESAQDWDALLAVIYGKQDLVDPERGLMPFETLRAALVLGSEYDFERYRTKALSELKRLFPDTLSAWEAVRFRDSQYWTKEFELLELVLSFGNRAMLPSAYFFCIKKRYLEGILNEYRQYRDRPIPLDSLDELVVGRERMMNLLYDNVLKWCWDGTIPSGNCQHDESMHCGKVLFPFLREMTTSYEVEIQTLFDSFNITTAASTELCPECMKAASEEHTKGRQSAWAQLPDMFGLENWDYLREEATSDKET